MGIKIKVSTDCCISNVCPRCKQTCKQIRTISGEGYGKGKNARVMAEKEAMTKMQDKVSGLLEVDAKGLLSFIEPCCIKCNQLYPWICMDGGFTVRNDYNLTSEFYPEVQISEHIKKTVSTTVYESLCKLISALIVFGVIAFLLLSKTKWYRESKYKEYSKASIISERVYADIVNIIPTGYQFTQTDVHYYSNPEEIICECRTNKGKSIWVVFKIQEYNEYVDKRARFKEVDTSDLYSYYILGNGKPQYEFIGKKNIKYNEPIRIYGVVIGTGNYAEVGVSTSTCVDFRGIEPE